MVRGGYRKPSIEHPWGNCPPGVVQVMTVPLNVKYQELFLKLQRKARDARRGLWK